MYDVIVLWSQKALSQCLGFLFKPFMSHLVTCPGNSSDGNIGECPDNYLTRFGSEIGTEANIPRGGEELRPDI